MSFIEEGIRLAALKRDRLMDAARTEYDRAVAEIREMAVRLGEPGAASESEPPSITQPAAPQQAEGLRLPNTATAAIYEAIKRLPNEFTREELADLVYRHAGEAARQNFASCFNKMRHHRRGFREKTPAHGTHPAIYERVVGYNGEGESND